MCQVNSIRTALNHGSAGGTHASQCGNPRTVMMQIRQIMLLCTCQTKHIVTMRACLTLIGLHPLNKICQFIKNLPMNSSKILKNIGESLRLKLISWSMKMANTTIQNWVFSDLRCSIMLTARVILRERTIEINMNREAGITLYRKT